MAPAIAHFLLGAAVLLVFASPILLRYDINRIDSVWLIPIGGVWGIAPDLHNIAPVFADGLYALHGSPWMDLFGIHYTLDRTAIRARYYGSVFSSIAIFTGAVAGYWAISRPEIRNAVVNTAIGRGSVVALATATATPFATVAFGITVSVQQGFPVAAGLLGSESVLLGGLVVGTVGIAVGPLFAGGLELGLDPEQWEHGWIAVAGSAGIGCLLWGVGSGVLRLVSSGSVHGVSLGALAAVGVYGGIFGLYYRIIRTLFIGTQAEARRVGAHT